MANAESEGDFIRQYIENFERTVTCQKLVEAARKKYHESRSGNSEGEFILEYLKDPKKGNTNQCQEYVKEAMVMWRDLYEIKPSKKTNEEELAEIFGYKPPKATSAASALSKGNRNLIEEVKKLGITNENARGLVTGARTNWPEGASPASYAKGAPVAAAAAAQKLSPPPSSAKPAIRPHKPNLFPSVDLTALHSLDGLNAFIESKYRLGDEARMTVPTSRAVGAIMTNYKRYSFSKYQIMFSSGNNSDCLIHTFLTATCPAFRRLPQADKNAFATWVRLYVLPASPVLQRKFADDSPDEGELGGKTVGEEARLRFFTAGEFLADIDIGQIAMIYKINILTFEKQAGQQTVRLSIGTSDALQPNTPVYMFMNASGAHFESVRTDAGSYTIPLSLAYDILMIITEGTVKEAVERMSEASSVRTTARDFQIRLGNVGTANNLRRELDEKIQEAKRRLSGGGHRRQTRRCGIRRNRSKRLTRKA